MEEIGVLRWFREIANCQSFTKTAHRFGVSPAAISQGIARLEQQLGTRLFNRTTRQISLTAEGKIFLDKVGAGLASIDEAVELLRELRQEPSGLLRLSAISSFGRGYLMELMAEFLLRYPKINLDLAIQDAPGDLVKDGFDLAIRRSSQVDHLSVARPLCKSSVILAASPAYLARKGTPRRPGDLSMHDWVAVSRPAGVNSNASLEPVDAAQSSSDHPHFRIEVDPAVLVHKGQNKTDEFVVRQYPNRIRISEGSDTSIFAALSGVGIAFLSTNVALRYLRSGELKLVLPDYRITGDNDIYMQYPNRAYVAPKTRALIDFLLERLSSNPDLDCDPAILRQYAAT